jgi:cytochrome c oxidase assembly protein subunit 15
MTSLANAETGLAETNGLSPPLKAVRIWLFMIAGLVFAMVVVGGATRLTGSGLSITEWQPILGVVPPTSEATWQDAFEKYRQIPEYSQINPGMSLVGFKAIYWWEWTHRLLGRLIGVVFFIPFAIFLLRGSIPRALTPRIAALFVLGAAQGALGWFMVKSGLADRVDVSQYRLAAHLALAVAIAGFAFWLALSIGSPAREKKKSSVEKSALLVQLGVGILAGLVYLQIIAGAFVAGLKGGHASNTWPLMNGEIIPPGLDAFSPWYVNLFENPLTAQFAHRALAYAIAIFVAAFLMFIWNTERARALRLPMLTITAAVLVQIALGVATIVYGVPLVIALAHQANAILVFALSLWTLHRAISLGDFSSQRNLASGAKPRMAD